MFEVVCRLRQDKKKGTEMANIGDHAFYKVETFPHAQTTKQQEYGASCNGSECQRGDRSSYVAMADTFRLDFVGTKAD